jgi:hypothetical protein
MILEAGTRLDFSREGSGETSCWLSGKIKENKDEESTALWMALGVR